MRYVSVLLAVTGKASGERAEVGQRGGVEQLDALLPEALDAEPVGIVLLVGHAEDDLVEHVAQDVGEVVEDVQFQSAVRLLHDT